MSPGGTVSIWPLNIEAGPAAAPWKDGNHVAATVADLRQLRLDALPAQEVANMDGDWCLVARRVAVRLGSRECRA